MELKDVILSTLAEMENEEEVSQTNTQISAQSEVEDSSASSASEVLRQESYSNPAENELLFLKSIRERLLVLFEGFQAPNNANLEAKIDMTLNFLEYTLATIDERIEHIQKDTLL